ncbi:L-type lectin-domain containing receptor kinase VIII.2-like [Hordeum vulgare]|nr:L-type lectin-domain containing receptor kinase VIII.2-like [Hordeum vulgare]
MYMESDHTNPTQEGLSGLAGRLHDTVGKPISNRQPAAPVLSTPVDLAGYVKEQAFVGFSASTQGSTEIHAIEWWSFSTPSPPSPAPSKPPPVAPVSAAPPPASPLNPKLPSAPQLPGITPPATSATVSPGRGADPPHPWAGGGQGLF